MDYLSQINIVLYAIKQLDISKLVLKTETSERTGVNFIINKNFQIFISNKETILVNNEHMVDAEIFKIFFKTLENSSNINKIKLFLNKINISIADDVCKYLEKSSLSNLTITGSGMGDEYVIAIGQNLENNLNLRVLKMPNCQITQHGISVLANGLIKNNHLHKLILSSTQHHDSNSVINLEHRNKIGGDGIKDLTNALRKNKTLEILGLQNCQIDNNGFIAIADLIHEKCAIKDLDISENFIDMNIFYKLMKSLKKNSTLEQLNLKNVLDYEYRRKKMHKSELKCFNSLKHNKTLKYLNLEHNFNSAKLKKKLNKVLRHKVVDVRI